MNSLVIIGGAVVGILVVFAGVFALFYKMRKRVPIFDNFGDTLEEIEN